MSSSPRGTYLLIAEALRQEIQVAKDDDGALPSEADLAQQHGVARNTIRRALKLVEREGLIESVPGTGWRVSGASDRRTLIEKLTYVMTADSLSVGDRYPSETKLCERFGASRTAVRRALAQMEGQGLLEAVHGKGRTVRALPWTPN
ncbi:GntR family transcriptional regulator [Streptomyces hydrogenans]|uniref:GntR family transcriptional regulator n=1 Tax=Streptomyces hydrogenans TaxID=1873719 RepID=UPI00368CFF80